MSEERTPGVLKEGQRQTTGLFSLREFLPFLLLFSLTIPQKGGRFQVSDSEANTSGEQPQSGLIPYIIEKRMASK
jgi:hypothetical protein